MYQFELKVCTLPVLIICLLFNSVSAQDSSGEVKDDTVNRWLGPSREISLSSSASRDTPIFSIHMLPRVAYSAGVDLSLAEFPFDSKTLRLGLHGMLDLESTDDSRLGTVFILKGNNALWRGVYGFSLALSFDEWARSLWGERGALELTVTGRHESEHSTADNDEITIPEFKGRPDINNFIMIDAAARIPLGEFDCELRSQHKLFVGADPNYIYGPGLDVIFRWRGFKRFQPFSSTFVEYLFGNTVSSGVRADGLGGRVPDAYFVRNLTGIIVNGIIGDMQIYTSLEVGHGKGLLVFDEDFRWGFGVRVAFL